MRVRLIRPAYWTDADLHTRLSAEQREFYIGLWMLADDAGYLAWDAERVGAELYPYKTAAWRRRLTAWLEVLGPTHVRLLDCGRHVFIPNLTRFQTPPKPSSQVLREHLTCTPAGASGAKVAPAGTNGAHVGQGGTSTGLEGIGEDRKGSSPRAHAREAQSATTSEEAASEFRRRVPRP